MLHDALILYIDYLNILYYKPRQIERPMPGKPLRRARFFGRAHILRSKKEKLIYKIPVK